MAEDVLARLIAASPPQRVPGALGEVRTPTNTWRRTKFFITNDHVLVFGEEAGQPVLLAHTDIVGFDHPDPAAEPRRPHYTVRTADGEAWELQPTNWCGCGSSLKTFSPFPITALGT